MEKEENIRKVHVHVKRIKLADIKTNIKYEKRKIRKGLSKRAALKKEIRELVLELNALDVIEDVDGVDTLMASIDEKYGIEDNSGSDINRLFAEVFREYDPNEDFEREYDYFAKSRNEEDSTLNYPELMDAYNAAESKYKLCIDLCNRLDMSNFEHRLVRRRLEEMKRRRIGMAEIKDKRNGNRKGNRNKSRSTDLGLDNVLEK